MYTIPILIRDKTIEIKVKNVCVYIRGCVRRTTIRQIKNNTWYRCFRLFCYKVHFLCHPHIQNFFLFLNLIDSLISWSHLGWNHLWPTLSPPHPVHTPPSPILTPTIPVVPDEYVRQLISGTEGKCANESTHFLCNLFSSHLRSYGEAFHVVTMSVLYNH